MDCKICYSHFNNDHHRPMVGRCGHTLCLECSYTIQMGTCPFCKDVTAFYKASPNYYVIDMLNNRIDETGSYQAIARERAELISDLNDHCDGLESLIRRQTEKIKDLRALLRETMAHAKKMEDELSERNEEADRRSVLTGSIYSSIRLPRWNRE